MLNKSKSELVLALAETLVGKQVDTKAITKSLELICHGFSFDCGLVYEIDKLSHLNLAERILLHEIPPNEGFAIEQIDPQYRSYLSRELLTYIVKSDKNTSAESDLLEIFSAKMLLVMAVVDENTRIFGLLVFANADFKTQLSRSNLQTLSVLLSMFQKYIETRLYQNKLAFAQTSLESILNNTGIDIYVNDFYSHDILYVNKSMAAPYGGASQFLGNKCWQVLFPGQSGPCEFCPQKKLIDESGNPTKIYSWDYQRPFDGSWFRVFSTAFRWVDGRLAHLVSSADITENKRNEEIIQYMAYYDSLTKLPNRRMLLEECEQQINSVKGTSKVYVLFFDIDDFKLVNDTFGHDAGDELLVQLADFFSGIPMLKDAIYRNGGDEFVALIGGEVTKSNICSLSSFLHERFNNPWRLEQGNAICNLSLGVASYPENGLTAKELLHHADQAMYQVKKSGGAGLCFAHQL